MINPDLVSGILSIASGKDYSIEDIADKLGIEHYVVEMFLFLANFSKGEKPPAKILSKVANCAAFYKYCFHLQFDPKTFLKMLTLSFNLIKYEDVGELISTLQLKEIVEENFLKALMAISKSYRIGKMLEKGEVSKLSNERKQGISELQTYATPFFKMIDLNPNLAIIGIRLREGDFYILEDYKQYIQKLLPTPQTLKITQAMCGVLATPIKFFNPPNNLSNQFKYKESFEGALELMADVLGINPIVARIASFDKETYHYLEEKHGIPKGAVI